MENDQKFIEREMDASHHTSVLSIRDIKEVRDKVPASPATPLVEPLTEYFD